MMGADVEEVPSMAAVVIVTLTTDVDEFVRRLGQVDGARLVRELPPGRVVVALRGTGSAADVAALDGVVSVVVDSLEHPQRG
jgi:hypothetical protein